MSGKLQLAPMLGVKPPSVRLARHQADRRRASPPATRPRYDPAHPRYAAIHESGHSVVALMLGIRVQAVSAERQRLPDGDLVAGFARIEPLDLADIMARGPAAALPRMAAVYAGPIAEAMLHDLAGRGLPRDYDPPHPDEARLAVIAEAAVAGLADTDRRAAVERLHIDARDLATETIHRHIDGILAVASRLMSCGWLSGDEVERIVFVTAARLVDPC